MSQKFTGTTDDNIVREYDERMLKLENLYTDDEILLEVRRRGLLMRVEAETSIPERYYEGNFTESIQIENTFKQLASEATKECIKQSRLPYGSVWGSGEQLPWREKVRTLRIPLNFVVEKVN